MVKNGWDFLIHETLKSGVLSKWLDELSRLTEWYLDANSDGITFFFNCQYTLYLWNLMLGVHCSWTCEEWCFASSALRKYFRNWFSQIFLIKAWLSVKIRNDQKPRYSSCMIMVIEFHNFKILSSVLHGYHIPQFQSIAIPAMTFSSRNFKILPTFHHGIFSDWWSLFLFFFIIFFRDR